MGLAEVKADAKLHRERIEKMRAKIAGLPTEKQLELLLAELTENVFPMFESTVDAVIEDVASTVDDLAAAVDELIDQAEEVLHPETASKIISVLELGRLMAGELDAVAARSDDVSKKRLGELSHTYRQAAIILQTHLTSITLDESTGRPDEDEDDGEESEGDNE
jgi:hypothetical protein